MHFKIKAGMNWSQRSGQRSHMAQMVKLLRDGSTRTRFRTKSPARDSEALPQLTEKLKI